MENQEKNKMKIIKSNRNFIVGINKKININHCATISLKDNQQVTFIFKNKQEYDVVKKKWGYYATPSINYRLKINSFKTALVRNKNNRNFIMIVNKKNLKIFNDYLSDESMKLVSWLDNEETKIKCVCGENKLKKKFHYNKKPKYETDFGITQNNYERFFYECKLCGHMKSDHFYDLEKIYKKEYVAKTYGKLLNKEFKKIINYPKNKSDNYWRKKRIIDFSKKFFKLKNKIKIPLLDIGSGLGVFPYSIKDNFKVTAIDPDAENTKHLKNIKIKTIKGYYKKNLLNNRFNIITINKVLEHIEKPEQILKNLRNNIKKNHFIYIEVPDGENAKKYGKNREEFFIEHFHAFSIKSLEILCLKFNLSTLLIKSIKEPSGKYTIYGFFKISNI